MRRLCLSAQRRASVCSDRRVEPVLRAVVDDRVGVGLECEGAVSSVVPEFVDACVDDDAVQPAADGGVVAERAGVAVYREHGVLEDVGGVLGAAAVVGGQAVQPAVMPAEQFLERVPVTGDVGCQQIGVAAWGRTVGAEHWADGIGAGRRGHFSAATAVDRSVRTRRAG